MSHQKGKADTLEPGITHFLKITRSYWSGLFHCYEVEGLPRTNNVTLNRLLVFYDIINVVVLVVKSLLHQL
ncbi:transposase [Anabaenopsis circularis NIES-21]|uniref:Transposase n=1 Tax=Anabaenopsis circularis NIES-21 TaxID=1085406 RepID=A0A1Z4GR15_9CYAN|nr:transposase [Anabaenopsis circularis NIES-21]